ncbi:MAG: lpg1661 family Dot/Icm T4SS effector [Bacteroidia bacterium]
MSAPSRLTALDALRGFTIAAMIIVNDPGSWSHVYPPLRHAVWHGITPTDFVFPFFLFIVGVSIVLSLGPRRDQGLPPADLNGKILRRAGIIFALGLFLWLFPGFDWAGIRLPGVLQRIALVFAICALLFLRTSARQQLYLGIGLLLGYWLVLALVPVPIDAVIREALATGEVPGSGGMIPIERPRTIGAGFIAPTYQPGLNLAAWIDRLLIPGRLWQRSWDPEGLLSTLPAIATGIGGMLAGHLLRSDKTPEQKTLYLLLGGFLAFTAGSVWAWFFPLNKNLWSSSFVLYTAGLAAMGLGAMYWLVDIRGHRRWTGMGIVFGANAITAYVLHGVLGDFFRIPWGSEGTTITALWMDTLIARGLAPAFASLLWAIAYMLLCYLPVWLLYRRRVFIKI